MQPASSNSEMTLSSALQQLDITTDLEPCAASKGRHFKRDFDPQLGRHIYRSERTATLEIICEYCQGYTCQWKDMAGHYESCPSFQVLCPHACSDRKIKRTHLESHLLNQCPLYRARCEYHCVGCEAVLMRMEMQDHMENNVKEHLSLISSKYSEIIAIGHIDLQRVEYIYVSNLPDHKSCQKQLIKSCFGDIGAVECVQMIPYRNAAIVEFKDKQSYASALQQSHTVGINLLQHRLRVTPIHNSST